jgi:hypothetical protein
MSETAALRKFALDALLASVLRDRPPALPVSAGELADAIELIELLADSLADLATLVEGVSPNGRRRLFSPLCASSGSGRFAGSKGARLSCSVAFSLPWPGLALQRLDPAHHRAVAITFSSECPPSLAGSLSARRSGAFLFPAVHRNRERAKLGAPRAAVVRRLPRNPHPRRLRLQRRGEGVVSHVRSPHHPVRSAPGQLPGTIAMRLR